MGNALFTSEIEKEQALHIRKACEKGDHFELARLLRIVRRGPGSPVDAIEWDWKNKGNALCSSAAHYAARGGHDKCLELLLQHGAGCHNADFRGFYLVHEVCLGKRKISTMMLLKKAGANLNIRNYKDGWNAAHICAHDNAPELLEYILRSGGYVNAKTRLDQATPLHLACKRRNVKCMQLLILFGADPKELDLKKEPPISSIELSAAVAEAARVAEERATSGLPPLLPHLEPDPLRIEYYQCLVGL